MQVQDDFLKSIPVDSHAEITAGNLLGTKYINVKKGRSQQILAKGGVVLSQDVPTIDDFVRQGNTIATALQSIVTKAGVIIDQVQAGKGSIGMLLVDDTIAKNLTKMTVDGQKLVVTLNSKLNSDDNTLGKFVNDKGAMYDDVRASIAKINSLMDQIEHGDGTVGKFMKDPAVFDESRKAIADLRKI